MEQQTKKKKVEIQVIKDSLGRHYKRRWQAKATKVEIEKRRATIEQLLLSGALYREIVEYCKKNFDISIRQTDAYIAQIYKEWKKRIERVREEEYLKALARRELLYRKALQEGDIRTALAIEQDIRRLQGFYVEKIEHSGQVKTFLDWVNQQADLENNNKDKKKEEK